MLREPPSRVLRLGRVHVQPNVVVPREVMYGGFVRWYRKHLPKRFIVTFVPKNARLAPRESRSKNRNPLFVTDGPPTGCCHIPQEDDVVWLEMHREMPAFLEMQVEYQVVEGCKERGSP